jgi:hypothetical protein
MKKIYRGETEQGEWIEGLFLKNDLKEACFIREVGDDTPFMKVVPETVVKVEE